MNKIISAKYTIINFGSGKNASFLTNWK